MVKQTKFISAALFLGVLLLTCGSAFAVSSSPATGTDVAFFGNNVQFTPVPANLYDLDHSYAYAWGFNYSIPQGQYIDTASISFDQINNWENEPNVLYVSLLENAINGVGSYYDAQGTGNFFGSTLGAQQLTQYDNMGTAPFDLKYDFTGPQLTALNAALADGNAGLGFDPDCHYFNKGIKMDITTKVVPEPISCVLFVVGSGVLGGLRKLRRKA
jgi:hypothetical protein